MTELRKEPSEQKLRWFALAIIMTTTLVMGRLTFNDFTWWDDNDTVHHNPRLNPPNAKTFEYYWTHSAFRIYAPLTYMAWEGLSLIARVTPDPEGISLNPAIFHGANLLLHLLSSFVVIKILLRSGANLPAAFCGSLVFAIHPIQVEAVAWVSGLKDVLSGLFALTALWQYLRFAMEPQSSKQRYRALLPSICSLILAMLAKPTAMTVPLAAFAMDRWIARRPLKVAFLQASALLVFTVPFFVVAHIIQSADDFLRTPFWQRPLIACDSLMFYRSKLIWPTNLCIDYGHTPSFAMQQPQIYFEWMVPLFIGLALFAARRHAQPLIAASLVFVAGCLPTLGLVTFATQFLSTTADHYVYWAMLGPALAVAWVLTKYPRAVALQGAVVLILIGWAVLSIRQGAVWKNDVSLLQRTIAVNPRSFAAYSNLGNDYGRSRNVPAAADMFRRAIAIDPQFALAHSNLAAALHLLGQRDQSIIELQRSIEIQRKEPLRLRASWTTDLNRLSETFLDMRHPLQASAALRESLAANPNQPDAIAMLARAEAAIPRPGTGTVPSSAAR
jgi:protein O-mannosyl-transferase